MDGARQNLYFSYMGSPIPVYFLYGEAPQPPDEARVHVETIAARSRQHDWTIQPHRHRDLQQLLLLQSGGLEARIDDRKLAGRGPCIVVVPANVVHAFKFDVGSVGLVTTFAIGVASDVVGRSAELREFLERPSFSVVTRRALAATDLARLAAMLLLEFERSAGGREVALRGLLAALVANAYRIAAFVRQAHSVSGVRDRDLIAKFRAAIEQNFLTRLGIEGYCTSLGVSESQLRRACLRVTDQPPVALIHLRVLVEAERQLRYTALSIMQIAYLLGFDDPAYFTRFFRQRTGVSPKAFRSRTV